MPIIEVKNLKKYYGNIKAVDNISFYVNEGECFGLVGPNGSGKTTTIECLEGIREANEGEIKILNLDPYRKREELHKFIGVQLQETNYQDNIKVYEICKLFSSFYDNPINYEKLLKEFQLWEKRNEKWRELSGGQKQKLSIILALIPNPKILFLDEITTGLDPKARKDMWNLIKKLKNEGKTIFMTTHYMEEAEELCDRVGIMVKGKIIALDNIKNLINLSGIEEKVIIRVKDKNLIEKFKNSDFKFSINGNSIEIFGKNLLFKVGNFIQKEGIEIIDLTIKKPNLEDVYLKLTGERYENE